MVSLAFAAFLATHMSASPFPLAISPDQRHLVTHQGQPFPILGRTSWFITSLNLADRKLYLDDTLAKGFNAIEFHVINHDQRGNNAPRDGSNNLPFLKTLGGQHWSGSTTFSAPSEAPDFTTPNPSYWANVDSLISTCESSGILTLMFPAYVGYAGGEQGWMKEVVANGPDKMTAYGKWLGRRFQRSGNIVWMAGGDLGVFNSEQRESLRALYNGINSTVGLRSGNWSAEWDSGMIASDQPDFGSMMTLNGTYIWTGSPAALGHRAYNREPVMPSYLLEEPYDQEGPDGNNVNPNAIQPTRKYIWWGWLSTIGGYVAGNGYIWPFRSPQWKESLDAPQTRSLAVMNKLIKSIRWWTLVPCGTKDQPDIVVDNPADAASPQYVASAIDPHGKLLVAYVPPGRKEPLKLRADKALNGLHFAWVNPSSGIQRPTVPDHASTRELAFPLAGAGADGFDDWILIGRAK